MLASNLTNRRRFLSATVLCLALPLIAHAQRPAEGPQRWETQIAAFESQDRQQPPAGEGILFVGSSSIRGWNLNKYFPDLPVINRGFGGSQLFDSVHFAPRIVLPCKPRTVVLYAGDNDIAQQKSPEQVANDFGQFVKTVHAALPQTRIIFIAIKPSLRRWNLVEQMRQANALIRKQIAADPRLVYVDIDAPMIGADGQPRKELFQADGLHLNDTGYALWASLLRPHLAPQ